MGIFPRRVGLLLATLMAVTLRVGAQELSWVRGTVTARADNVLTVHLAGLDLNVRFTVDESTLVIGRGAGVRIVPPERLQPTLSDLVRLGDSVEVHYSRRGEYNDARVIRPVTRPGKESGRSVPGVVTAISSDELTVRSDEHEATFAVEPGTVVPGAERGTQKNLADLISRNDLVLVLYRVEATTRVATEICMLRKSR